MRMIAKVAAASSATAAVAGAVWIVAGSTSRGAARTGSTSFSAPTQGTLGPTIICAGADSILRVAAAAQGCAHGQIRLEIAQTSGTGTGIACDCDPWNPRERNKPDSAQSTEDALARIAERLRGVENSAEFTVVDRVGHSLFGVYGNEALLYNGREQTAVRLLAADSGGFLMTRSTTFPAITSIGASPRTAGVRLMESGRTSLDLGRQSGGNYALVIPSKLTGLVAAIGESKAGTGALTIGDRFGHTRASMTVVDGKGTLGVFNAWGTAVLSLTEGATSGGLLAIGDGSGEPVVKMGVNEDRYGVVLAGPVAGLPLVPASGLPGSYFMGCAGAEACAPMHHTSGAHE